MTGGGAVRVELVMFDLDGTLVATAPGIHDGVNEVLQLAGLAPIGLEQVEHWIGHGTRELLVQALALRTGSSPQIVREGELVERALAAFAEAYERRGGTRSSLYPHVLDVLEALGRRGVKRAVVTNKEQRFTAAILQRHGLQGRLDHVVCGDTLAARKPHPDGVFECLRRFGVAARSALFIGDSSIDVATARNAGVPVWAVTYGYNMGEPIAAAQPDRLLDSLRCVLEEQRPH